MAAALHWIVLDDLNELQNAIIKFVGCHQRLLIMSRRLAP